jgi:hypothetical protein
VLSLGGLKGLKATEPHPIKVATAAPSDNIRATEIAIETAKTGKVTAVIMVMDFFVKKDAIHGTLSPSRRSFLAKRQIVTISRSKNPVSLGTFS